MNIVLSRTLPDDALSKYRVCDMRPDEVILVSCDTVAEFNNSRRIAEYARKSMLRTDGYAYKIETNSTCNTVKVSLYKQECEAENTVCAAE